MLRPAAASPGECTAQQHQCSPFGGSRHKARRKCEEGVCFTVETLGLGSTTMIVLEATQPIQHNECRSSRLLNHLRTLPELEKCNRMLTAPRTIKQDCPLNCREAECNRRPVTLPSALLLQLRDVFSAEFSVLAAVTMSGGVT